MQIRGYQCWAINAAGTSKCLGTYQNISNGHYSYTQMTSPFIYNSVRVIDGWSEFEWRKDLIEGLSKRWLRQSFFGGNFFFLKDSSILGLDVDASIAHFLKTIP